MSAIETETAKDGAVGWEGEDSTGREDGVLLLSYYKSIFNHWGHRQLTLQYFLET